MENQIISFLTQLLARSANPKGLDWLSKQADKITSEAIPSTFFLAFSQSSRYFKKEKISFSADDSAKANQLTSGFEPQFWNQLQTARTVLMLSYPQQKESWFATMNQLFETADMHEHQALFAALPLMPFQEDLIPRAIDGLRTNISLVFDAIALDNPFPAKYFPEANWNQMVLKAIFMQHPLYRIQGLKERRNPALAAIARDFAHERWAAGRVVMPEIWRLVAPFVNDMYLDDLKKALATKDQLQVKAVLLTLKESAYAPAKELLESLPAQESSLDREAIAWETVGSAFQLTRV
ncbi:EboA domain-containing protein [Algoriphagus sp. C2-6-M1]|uniref:EboA domain-containing protein n=1 Tax=Algoriphagus persicinus TaxID=3108754 RepID=UPI002B3E7AC0|nr:EboA domain-containing protein [Algoriphagus sp. C2-6-M1]MEB2782501.1 EboA domain-containing protein [Algoriphagus sp. C2-6-M1]